MDDKTKRLLEAARETLAVYTKSGNSVAFTKHSFPQDHHLTKLWKALDEWKDDEQK